MNEDQRQLCEANYPLIYAFAKKYCKYPSQFEEVVFYATNGYVNACRVFDASKGFKFSSYAYKCMYHELVSFYKNLEKDSQNISLDAQYEDFRESVANYLVSDDEIAEDTLIDDERDDLFHRINNLLSRYEKRRDQRGDAAKCRCLIERMRLGLSQEDYAQLKNMSQTNVSKMENEAIQILKKDKRLIKLYREWMSYKKFD